MDSRLQDLEDTHEETKTPPPKKGKAKAADAGRPTPPKRTISAVSEGDSQKPKRGKKAKEGPYTCGLVGTFWTIGKVWTPLQSKDNMTKI